MAFRAYGYNMGYEDRACGCCGCATKAPPNTSRKWKNQYGEGVTKGTPDYNPIDYNRRGILIIDGKAGKPIADEMNEVHHVKTKNGIITVALRTDW